MRSEIARHCSANALQLKIGLRQPLRLRRPGIVPMKKKRFSVDRIVWARKRARREPGLGND